MLLCGNHLGGLIFCILITGDEILALLTQPKTPTNFSGARITSTQFYRHQLRTQSHGFNVHVLHLNKQSREI